MSSISENIVSVKKRIKYAAERSGRDWREIKIVAVTKTFPAEYIMEAYKYGIKDIGENRVQEAFSKYSVISKSVIWHLVGHLQTNKVKKALEIFDLIHSVDSIRLAEEINRRANSLNKVAEVLVEVNTTSEDSKFGITPKKTVEFVKEISQLSNIAVMGLMTIGVFSENPEDSRKYYVMLRELKERLEDYDLGNGKMKYLSMGMSNDFEVAVEEGANIVRIGTAIFGNREV